MLGYEALPVAASSGSFFGALDLAELYSNDKKSSGYGPCVGYIAGVVGAVLSIDKDQNRQAVCLPDGIKLNQLVEGYPAYFEANPDVLEEDAEDIGIEMLEARYPC